MSDKKKCPDCNGEGNTGYSYEQEEVIYNFCYTCKSTGEIENDTTQA